MILGQNGFWGDLLTVSDDGVSRIREWIDAYKKVRDDITAVGATRVGDVGGSPEIYEKINPKNGRGVVVIFAAARGRYQYITRSPVAPVYYKTDGITICKSASNNAILEIVFKESGAQMVFFG